MSILLNQLPIVSFNFPAGETHVRLPESLDFEEEMVVKANLMNGDSVMELLLTVDAVRRVKSDIKISLEIPYFPYARQDRVCNNGEALSVKVMADLINRLNCQQVTIVDPHSDVTPALLNNCVVKTQSDVIINSGLLDRIIKENWALISPDAGAKKKVHQLAKRLSNINNDFEPDIFYGEKTRNTQTGEITGTSFIGDVYDRQVLIVDDICDGGRTFIELAKLLQKQQAKKIFLYITHGIFSKCLDVLRPYFDQIYCYHVFSSYHQQDHDFLVTLSDQSQKISLNSVIQG